jgi:hypothetical protein
MTVREKVAIGPEEKGQPAASERARHRNDRCSGGAHSCLVPQRVCLREKESCKKGDAR